MKLLTILLKYHFVCYEIVKLYYIHFILYSFYTIFFRKMSEENTNCAICLERENKPITLMCGHSFCLLCVAGVYNSQEWTYCCPFCRRKQQANIHDCDVGTCCENDNLHDVSKQLFRDDGNANAMMTPVNLDPHFAGAGAGAGAVAVAVAVAVAGRFSTPTNQRIQQLTSPPPLKVPKIVFNLDSNDDEDQL